jgi:16S rRNA pseudouridine516 synthase
MKYKTTRLDRFISKNSEHTLSDIRLLIAQKRILLDDQLAHSVQQPVTKFTRVALDGKPLQEFEPVYIMLNKPQGVVSATKDSKHTTVLDLIDHPLKDQLHIVGRLDLNTTGLVLLTNDGVWSRRISAPESKLEKTYEVTLSKPVTEEYVAVFHEGIYFAFEDITTKPARSEIVTDFIAKLTLIEGRYHQVKRMFGFFQNKVLALHRTSVGNISLDGLEIGQSKILTADSLQLEAQTVS